jgi:hypothetical protein
MLGLAAPLALRGRTTVRKRHRGRRGDASIIVADAHRRRGVAKLTDFLPALANCSRMTDSASIYDRCKAGFAATIPRHRPLPPSG